MASFYGADVEQLRQLGKEFQTQAHELDAVVARLSSRIAAVEWRGPDAQRFRDDWGQNLSRSLRRVSSVLEETGSRASANANQQEATSAGGTGTGVAGGSFSVPGDLGVELGTGPFALGVTTMPEVLDFEPPAHVGIADLSDLDPSSLFGIDPIELGGGARRFMADDQFIAGTDAT